MTLSLVLWVTVWTSALGAQAPVRGPLARVEFAFQQARYWDDQLRLAESIGMGRAATRDSLSAATARFGQELRRVPARGLSAEDHRALAIMRRALHRRPTEETEETRHPLCDPHTEGINTLDRLTDATMACYGAAQEGIVVGADTLDRLTILGRISQTDDPDRRRELFLALEPTWRSVNGKNEPVSPYRRLLRLRRGAWRGGNSPLEQKGAAFGLAPAELERWLERALEAWRLASPDTLLQPWDWYHWTGGASRALGPRIPSVENLARIDRNYYRQIGADPERLGIHHDLGPRPGKYAVAYTDFGARGRWDSAGRHLPAEPWVFATYGTGGLDNLAELLHETGHAIHLAALHTRPAFLDWPDDDTFTEALADLPAAELYEPAWQQRFLGDSVPSGMGLRARYAGVVLDLAWALFELRVHATPDADPNLIWTDLTSRYLRIAPHPEWSWWAMRGQLVDAPGYIINYALGAFIAADLRARVRQVRGEFAWFEPETYPWLSDRLYRFGLERSSRRVLQDFLGRPLRPDAMLHDLQRMAR